MALSPSTPPLRHLAINSRSGSRQHFYHFMLGVLVPLGQYLARTGEQDLPLILRDCGPMNEILHELDLPCLMLAETKSFIGIGESLPPEMLRKVTVTGLDIGKMTAPTYDGAAITAGARWLLARWQTRIAPIHADIVAKWPQRPRVMIIERGPPHPFFASARSDVRTSGAARRHVANHKEVVTELARRNPGVRNVRLEGLPLASQIALFRAADVVVAQHGAALTNVLWMRPGTAVVEISGGKVRTSPYFNGLATLSGARHIFFPQPEENGPVDVAALAAAVSDMGGAVQLAG